MSNERTNHWKGIHMFSNDIGRHVSLHLHLDPASRMHRHIYYSHNLCLMHAERQLLD